MTHSTLYPPASQGQSYSGGQYGGSTMSLAAPVVVLHSTEGPGWPSYSSGGVAPTLTYWPIAPGNCQWRQHFRINESARALMNKAGGVQTNTAGAVQVELVGTCDPATRARIPGIMFWPEAPDWALQPLADFLSWMHREWALPLVSTPRPWLSYPSSYGNSAARMSFTEWDNFSGICGHQHVPENDHGDPGNLNVPRLLQLATPSKQGLTPPAAKPSAPPESHPITIPERQDDDMSKPFIIQTTKTDGSRGNAVVTSRGMSPIYSGAELATVQKWAACFNADGSLDTAKVAKAGFSEDDAINLRNLSITA